MSFFLTALILAVLVGSLRSVSLGMGRQTAETRARAAVPLHACAAGPAAPVRRAA